MQEPWRRLRLHTGRGRPQQPPGTRALRHASVIPLDVNINHKHTLLLRVLQKTESEGRKEKYSRLKEEVLSHLKMYVLGTSSQILVR